MKWLFHLARPLQLEGEQGKGHPRPHFAERAASFPSISKKSRFGDIFTLFQLMTVMRNQSFSGWQEFAKSLSSKPYNAAELWELHQFYFSPPTEDAASLLSSSQWSSSDEDDEEGAAGDSKRYCHSKNRSYGPHGAAISSNSDSNGHCGPAVMDAKSRKKRATISTMVRIAQYPRVKVSICLSRYNSCFLISIFHFVGISECS